VVLRSSLHAPAIEVIEATGFVHLKDGKHRLPWVHAATRDKRRDHRKPNGKTLMPGMMNSHCASGLGRLTS